MAANPETAIAVIEQSPDAIVEWNLDNWPEDRFNRLIPTQTLGLATDFIRPIVQVVVLDIERDTYSSSDLPKDHRAPNVRGLAVLAAAAGVDFVDEERTDDGSDPMRASAKVKATMVDGSGRVRTVVGSRDYVLSSLPMTDAQRTRAKGYVYEHAVTRARHRALRVLLGLRQSYPVAELQRAFAVVSYVPNTQHPEIREIYKQAMLPAIAATFGPAKQLTSGADVIDLDQVEEKNVTPAPSTPAELPGEKLAAAASPTEEPAWLKPSTPAAAAPTTKRRGAKSLPERLRESFDASELQGDATESQQLVLRELAADLPWATELLPVLAAAFGPDWDGRLSAPHAQAILNVAEAFEAADPPIDFAAAWREASAAVRKAAEA